MGPAGNLAQVQCSSTCELEPYLHIVLPALLLGHSEHVYLAAVQPILEFFMGRFQVMFACEVKMQENIVNLVEQRFV